MVQRLVQKHNGTFVPQAGVRLLLVGAESLLPHSLFAFLPQILLRHDVSRYSPICPSMPLRRVSSTSASNISSFNFSSKPWSSFFASARNDSNLCLAASCSRFNCAAASSFD